MSIYPAHVALLSHAQSTQSSQDHNMTLSEKHLQTISERPLNDTLDPLRDRLRDTNEADDPVLDDVARLLVALFDTPAAFSLPSPDGSGNVAVKLSAIHQRVRGGLVELGQFCPLIRHVLNKSPDIDIWEAVYTIIENHSDITPPPSSIAATFKGTPVKTSLSQLADSETRDIVERELFFEIQDCTFRNVGGFMDKFFSPKGKSYDKSRFKEDFLQLTRYVRSVFADQPTRRYIHAFLLCASTIELWIFDRSGPYSSG